MTSQQRVHSWADGKDLVGFGLEDLGERTASQEHRCPRAGAPALWFYSGAGFWPRHLHVRRLLVLGNCTGHQVARVLSLLCLLLSRPHFLLLANPQDLPNF